MSRHPMPSTVEFNTSDYPCVVTLRFHTPGEAEDALHDLENEVRSLRYPEGTEGQNVYFVDHGLPDPDYD
jgi:hypothetical protein